jgi:uncharacterized protein (TIGR03437 family)
LSRIRRSGGNYWKCFRTSGSVRREPGDTIVIYGVGFGSVNPKIPPGQIAEESGWLAAQVSFSIGGQPAQTAYDGLAPGESGAQTLAIAITN